MTTEQLTYIVELANSRTLAEAAKHLNISQSGLSQSITLLESELNVKIFDRDRSGTSTTFAGQLIVNKANEVLNKLLELHKLANKFTVNKDSKIIRFSVSNTLLKPFLDAYLEFQTKPALKMEIIESSSVEIIEAIKTNKIDLGFIAMNKSHETTVKNMVYHPIAKGNLKLYATKDNVLTKQKEISIEKLKEQQFALFTDEYNDEFINRLQNIYGPFSIIMRSNNPQAIRIAVKGLNALTLGRDFQTFFSTDDLFPELSSVDISGIIDTSYTFGWLYNEKHELTKAEQQFITVVNRKLKHNLK